MVPISVTVPRSQTRSTAASDKAGRSVVTRSVRPCVAMVCAAMCPDLIGRPLIPRAGDPVDRATGPSRVMRRARSSMGMAARMISAEMTMIAYSTDEVCGFPLAS
jgi:hypothetical protein